MTPLSFTGIHLKNFLSFGNCMTEIDLTYFGSTHVVGENLDAGGANGVGKCVSGSTPINIRNKKTGKVSTISIGELFETIQKQRRKNQ